MLKGTPKPRSVGVGGWIGGEWVDWDEWLGVEGEWVGVGDEWVGVGGEWVGVRRGSCGFKKIRKKRGKREGCELISQTPK